MSLEFGQVADTELVCRVRRFSVMSCRYHAELFSEADDVEMVCVSCWCSAVGKSVVRFDRGACWPSIHPYCGSGVCKVGY